MAGPQDKVQYGDFQTPLALSAKVCELLSGLGVEPRSLIEPTCGEGNFVISSLRAFDSLEFAHCVELNDSYVRSLRSRLEDERLEELVNVVRGDFFKQDWGQVIESCPKPLLILGNPPWVTNSVLGKLNGTNLPSKSNFQGHKGFEALTGKSNFDISEWILIHLLQWASEQDSTVAMLVKTSVARKVLLHRWKNGLGAFRYSMYRFDAQKSFGVSVDSCLFIASPDPGQFSQTCSVYDGFIDSRPNRTIGFKQGSLISDTERFERSRHLLGSSTYVWRSGIKHDCASVMELIPKPDGSLTNKLGDHINIEGPYLFPLLKSSDIANKRTSPRRYTIVTQSQIGENTEHIQIKAPLTWKYLMDKKNLFDKRSSSIYNNKPAFSIFGIGPYSFAPYKLSISGMYKKFAFTVVGPHEERPVMLDDTCYFLPCQTRDEAEFIKSLLEHDTTRDLIESLVFWDEKRPITVSLLKKIDLRSVAEHLGCEDEYLHHLTASPYTDTPKMRVVLELDFAG